MAKQALLDVLEQTIGKYVKNLDAKSLNVAVWSGKIELHSLELDIEAVNAELDRQAAEAPNLALPFRVLSGNFESFEVDVPWTRITNRSVVLRAFGLKVDVEPYDRLAQADHLQAVVANEEKRVAKIQKARKKSIESSEKYRLQALAVRKLALAESTTENKATFGSKLVRRIIENIQIEIKDVTVSLTDPEGSAGVVLDSLSLVTTDADGKRVFVDRMADTSPANSFLYKMLQIKGFGIYLDQDVFGKSHKLRPIDESGLDETERSAHSYILAPLSFEARLRQADGNVCVDYSKYHLSSELSSLSILLSRNQMDLMRRISTQISSSEKGPLFPEYRPLKRVSKETAGDWWKYAVRCIGRLNGRRSWNEFFLAYKKRKRYIPLYKRYAHHKTCSWIKPLNAKETEELVELEKDRTILVAGIMAWRTVADGQVDKEREKHDAHQLNSDLNYFSSIFGNKEKPKSKRSEEDDPPLHLTDDELKEIELMSKEEFSDPELSTDSKLCDINFVLNAMKINLTSYDLRHLAALEMGTVSVDFEAAANGAYAFNFDLFDLEVQDRVTPNSLFPSVLRSIDKRVGSKDKESGAFNLHLSKTKTGDQKLQLKLAEFEAVASQILFRELKGFVSKPPVKASNEKANPILAQSISGSVDLFYDANEGEGLKQLVRSTELNDRPSQAATTVSDFSNVVFDAWKEKTETKASWVIDIDVKAPVVTIPEKCNDPRANLLVFDLGHLTLKYGKIEAAQKVLQWFVENPKENSPKPTVDSGNLSINDLTFKAGKANEWRRLLDSTIVDDINRDSAIIEPISVVLDFGIGSTSSQESPRICSIGVIPTISLKLSPEQGSKVFSVIGAWSDFLDDMREDYDAADFQVAEQHLESVIATNAHDYTIPDIEKVSSSGDHPKRSAESVFPAFYFLIGLQRLSVVIAKDSNNRLEAHLVSVYASTSILSDRSSIGRLSMGWFWILDRMDCEHPRRQRLLAHSNLPKSPESFAEGDEYDILTVLTKQGVFDRDFSGSTALADISLKKPGGVEGAVQSILDANFSSLFIHWNPYAVKGINSISTSFASLAEEHSVMSDTGTLIMSPGRIKKSTNTWTPEKEAVKVAESFRQKNMLIKAKMESLDINLNSARDDYPLFMVTVSRAQVDILSSGKDAEASLSLGDLRMRTQENMGQTLLSYRTLIGLAPERSESLLNVKYYQGKGAITKLSLDPTVRNKLEAFAEVDLSPMRIVHLQSQVLALVEYITDGILGVLAARAASSAAEAAKEIANSVEGEKLFLVRATSIEAILPQAAYKNQFIAVHAGSLDIKFFMYPDPGGTKAVIALSDVSLKDSEGNLMQEKSIHMSLDVITPSVEVGSLDDQALKVDVAISEASFIMAKSQYAQILFTLDENIGEAGLFLRDDDVSASHKESKSRRAIEIPSSRPESAGVLTHAGVEAVDILRRMYLNVKVKVLALQLYGTSISDSLVSLAAVSAHITVQTYPHEDKTSSQVSLRNLVCEDCRPKALGRQYRYLIDQSGAGTLEDTSENLFYIGYTEKPREKIVDIRVGSPQVVLIPDAISEALDFFNVERNAMNIPEVVATASEVSSQMVDINSGENNAFEATLLSVTSTSYSLSTKICRIILVDLGSQLSREARIRTTSSAEEVTQLTETLVLQGAFSASLSMASDTESGRIINADIQSQGDNMEIFSAFGTELKSPLQVLEPTEGSAHGSLKTTSTGDTEIEVRAASLTQVEVTFSMHNAALLNAILNSLSESFGKAGPSEVDFSPHSLSAKETERIENLASALEARKPINERASSRESLLGIDESSSHPSNIELEGHERSTKKIQVKLTMPETRVTVINDLQGLDDALFRVSVINFVAGLQLKNSFNQVASRRMTFDFHLNTSILADYFDGSLNLWSKLLTRPWEVTLKGVRSPSRRYKSDRLSTTIDLESFPCCISFSEQFLVSLASAHRMWSIYTVATAVPEDDDLEARPPTTNLSSLKHSMAATAARNLITSLPYAIENHCGANAFFSLPGGSISNYPCPNGSIRYFRFEPPKGGGYGGKRAYGQDVEFEKTVTLRVGNSAVEIGHLDREIAFLRRSHDLKDGRILFTHVVKEGKTTVLHLTSHVSFVNNTSIPFALSVWNDGFENDMGICMANNEVKGSDIALSTSKGVANKDSQGFSVPIDLLRDFVAEWAESGQSHFKLGITPCLSVPQVPNNSKLKGSIDIAASLRQIKNSQKSIFIGKHDVTCRPEKDTGQIIYPFAVQVVLKMTLVDKTHAQIDVRLEPRAIIENKIPVDIQVRTPMPHTFGTSLKGDVVGNDTSYVLQQDDRIEIFTPGPSIAVTIKTSDSPVGGTSLGWLNNGWIDLPLVPEFSLHEPLNCLFPFTSNNNDPEPPPRYGANGSEFFIVEGFESLAELALTEDGKKKKKPSSISVDTSQVPSVDNLVRIFYLTVCCYGVDHTKDILFDQVSIKHPSKLRNSVSSSSSSRKTPIYRESSPFSAFASKQNSRRISLLPSGIVPLRLLQLTVDGNSGVKKSLPFFIEELAIGEGGVDTTPVLWENKIPSGYFAYRTILNEHQSEIHIVPEYIVFNGSKHAVVIKERGKPEFLVESGNVGQLRIDSRENGLKVAFTFIEMGAQSVFVSLGKLGLKVVILHSAAGYPVGSVCVQTVIDTQGDARLVVKIGDVKTGNLASKSQTQEPSMFRDDFFRFRVRWTELQLILDEVQELKSDGAISRILARALTPRSTRAENEGFFKPSTGKEQTLGGHNTPHTSPMNALEVLQQPVASIIFSRFTFDYQRVFKEPSTQLASNVSPERSQISLIVHNVLIKDLTPDSTYPIVFNCTSTISFLDLCIRVRGPLDADLVQVDLFDLNLAHDKGKSERIILTTSENYVWRLLGLMNRIIAASSDFAGVSLELQEDEEHGGFIVKISDSQKSMNRIEVQKYRPPKSDTLYDIALLQVSPFNLCVSFQRNPQASRYKKARKTKGATLMNYFTRRLKFTIEGAELKFARYEDRTLKGPPDRLVETLAAVYISRMKFKLVTLLSAASLQDWRFLAARDTGNDEYVEGDILRATGNLAGKSANLLLKRAAGGLGSGVADLTGAIGDSIESSANMIGVGRVGAGVNSVISGVGDGVGSTLIGVGSGAGKILKGTGQGIGQVFGGVAGGAVQVGKGLGKGITKGDGKAVVDGFAKGATSVGGGIAQGAESAVMGAADGLVSAGKGLFSGVKSVGRGLGGAVKGKKYVKKPPKPKR